MCTSLNKNFLLKQHPRIFSVFNFFSIDWLYRLPAILFDAHEQYKILCRAILKIPSCTYSIVTMHVVFCKKCFDDQKAFNRSFFFAVAGN